MIKAIITDLKVSKTPDIKTSNSGKVYTSIPCSCYAGKDKDGNAKYLNVRVALFGKTAERSAELVKGSLINVWANITDLSHYMKDDGSISKTLELTADTYEKPLSQRPQGQTQQSNTPQPRMQEAPDEDLPF